MQVHTASPDIAPAHTAYGVVGLPAETDAGGRTGPVMPVIEQIARFLIDRWEGHPPDVVHCHGWIYGMAAQLAADRRRLPTVQSFPGLGTLMRSQRSAAGAPRIRFETLLAARNATVVAAQCGDDLDELNRLGCPRSKITVVPPGGNVDEDVSAALTGLGPSELLLIDQDGDQRLIGRIASVAAELGVENQVRAVPVPGPNELSDVLRTADVVVCPASYDAHATVTLRAMAAGTTVVAAAAGGMRDAVISEVTGLLVPPANPDALRAALRTVLSSPLLREGMGLAGRSRARSRYCWQRVAVDAEVSYRSAADRHHAGRGDDAPAAAAISR